MKALILALITLSAIATQKTATNQFSTFLRSPIASTLATNFVQNSGTVEFEVDMDGIWWQSYVLKETNADTFGASVGDIMILDCPGNLKVSAVWGTMSFSDCDIDEVGDRTKSTCAVVGTGEWTDELTIGIGTTGWPTDANKGTCTLKKAGEPGDDGEDSDAEDGDAEEDADADTEEDADASDGDADAEEDADASDGDGEDTDAEDGDGADTDASCDNSDKKCCGNCPGGVCEECICGTEENIVDPYEECSKFEESSLTCCMCIAWHESRFNSNALNYDAPHDAYVTGLWQISEVNWENCNDGEPPCSPESNLKCTKAIWGWAPNEPSWHFWATAEMCGCKTAQQEAEKKEAEARLVEQGVDLSVMTLEELEEAVAQEIENVK